MLFLTDFADLGVILPLTAIIALSLAVVGLRRDAIAWSVAVTGTLAALLLLKLAAFFTAAEFTNGGFGSPSGHTAAGTVVYAGLLTLAARHLAPRAKIALVAGIMVALVIGVTRMEVGQHTLADVLIGAAVGIAGVLALVRMVGPRPPKARASGMVVVMGIAFLVALASHGQRIPAEAALRSFAAHMQDGGEL